MATETIKPMSVPSAARLFELRLPEGDVGGLDIDVQGSTGQRKLWSKDWLSQGYDGIRIIGAGIGKTHMLPNWNGWTLNVNRHQGIVQLEALTIHAGRNAATLFGYENKTHSPLSPKFQLRMIEAAGVVDPPHPEYGRSKWLLFLNGADSYLRDVTLDATLAFEHACYDHGFASKGAYWDRVQVLGSGSQGRKVRSDSIETVKPPGTQWIVLKGCSFRNGYQPWSSRGGGSVVVEGGASNILIERCVFRGGGALGEISSNARSHAIMLSSEDLSYDAVTGEVGKGFGNGHVFIKDSAAYGFSEYDWNNSLVRCARNTGTQMSAQSLTITGCGLWGERMQFQFGQIPTGKVKVSGCNTPRIRELCGAALGMDVTHEATFAGPHRRIPLSEGLIL